MGPSHKVSFGRPEHLLRVLSESRAPLRVLVADCLHSMDGTYPPVSLLEEVVAGGTALYLDEAHSAGLGPGGLGWLAQHPRLKGESVGALFGCGKALGLSGGLVGTSGVFARRLCQKASALKYTTGPSPLLVALLGETLRLVGGEWGDRARKRLQKRLDLWDQAVSAHVPGGCAWLGDPGSPVRSLVAGDPVRALVAAERLRDEGFDVVAMRPPAVPRGTSRLRFCLRASTPFWAIKTLSSALVRSLGS